MEAFKADDLQPIVEMAYRFGPFFFAVLCMLAAFEMWRKAGGRYMPLLFVSVGALCIAASIYYWVNPPSAIYVYKIAVFHDEDPGKTELNESTFLITSQGNDTVWTKVLPSINGGIGFRTFTYDAVALKDKPFAQDDTFVVDLVWYPRPADPQVPADPQRDKLRLPYQGGSRGSYAIVRVEDNTTDAGVFYQLAPAEEGARDAFRTTPFGLISQSQAQSGYPDKKGPLHDLSREELIELLEKAGTENVRSATTPITQEPVIVYYKKPSDKVDIEKELRDRGRVPQIQRSNLKNYPTNALWFGIDVPIDEAQRVAEDLIREGVELRYFGPFLREGAKANRIEIGTDTSILNDDVMTVEAVRQKAAELALARERG